MATPALVVDRDALTENIAVAQRQAAGASVRLRPHAKTHKCAAIAALQIAAGAVGICVAKWPRPNPSPRPESARCS